MAEETVNKNNRRQISGVNRITRLAAPFVLAVIISVMSVTLLSVFASCNISGMLVMTTSSTDVKVSANDSSSTVVSLEAGSPLYVTGDAVNGYYAVYYQGKTCYVRSDKVTYLDIVGNTNPDAVLGKGNNIKDNAITAEEASEIKTEDSTNEESTPASEEADTADADINDINMELGGLEIDAEHEAALAEEVARMQKEAEVNKDEMVDPDSDGENALDAELKAASEETDFAALEYEKSKKELRGTITWTVVIAILIVAILGGGFFIALIHRKSLDYSDDAGDTDKLNEIDTSVVSDDSDDTDSDDDLEIIDMGNL